MSVASELWASRDSQERVTQTLIRFLRARATFNDLIASSARRGGIPFDEVNAFVEDQLFALKEESHALFRSDDVPDELGLSTAGLFDLLLGSLFHEMMKVKESRYQVERYAPRYEKLRTAVQHGSAPENGASFLVEGDRIVEGAKVAVGRDLKRAGEVFGEATAVLRHVLVENRDNALLARNLLDNRELVENVYEQEKGGLDGLIFEMYDGAPAQGYVLAATDLLDGGWYDRARQYCQEALRIDADNHHATQLLSRVNAAARAHLEQ